MYVHLTGPVKITENAGHFERSHTEEMHAQFSTTDPEELNTAFTGAPKNIIGELTDEDEDPFGSSDYTPQDTWSSSMEESPWEVVVSGATSRRIYQAACEVAFDEPDPDATIYRRSPFHVLIRWAESGRYKTPSSGDNPASVAAILAECVAFQNEGRDGLYAAQDWDDITETWQYEMP